MQERQAASMMMLLQAANMQAPQCMLQLYAIRRLQHLSRKI
jgi:hypothetical protein